MIRRYKESEINELANILINDGVISVPTDTVYGICASINSKKAYEKLISIKGRPKNKAFPIMCADEQQIKKIAILDEKAKKIIKAFMPGSITLVLKKNNTISEYVTSGKSTIAVRIATLNVLKELIIKAGNPIFMTSANKSGNIECRTLEEIEKECPLLDGMLEGNVFLGEASTIVDCSSEDIKILRTGPISMEQIKNAIN